MKCKNCHHKNTSHTKVWDSWKCWVIEDWTKDGKEIRCKCKNFMPEKKRRK
jgi:hypothetical protein